MTRRLSLTAAVLGLATALTILPRAAHPDAPSEMQRLAALMDWKPGTVVADIGAGDGRYAFAAAQLVGPTGSVFATEIDPEKITALKSEIARRHIGNIVVVDSKAADTNLPAACCDAIFLRRVYHHLTKPAEFDQALLRSLKPAGRLAIIDFPPRSGLPPVEDIPANRGGHGIPPNIAIQELTAAGLQYLKSVDDWPENDYLLLFVKK